MRHQLELDMMIRGIVRSRGISGLTISEIRSEYFDIIYKPWPLRVFTTDQIIEYLSEIDGLIAEKIEDGPFIWYINDSAENITAEMASCKNDTVSMPSAVSSCKNDTVSMHTQSASDHTESNRYIATADYIEPVQAPIIKQIKQ